jgi:hypothetical protein
MLLFLKCDRLCGTVVRVPGYRSRDPGLDSRRYQIFWEVVGLERGPLSLVSITEELFEWKNSGSESRKPRLPAVVTLYQQKFALISPTSCGRSVSIVRLRTKSTEFSFLMKYIAVDNVCRYHLRLSWHLTHIKMKLWIHILRVDGSTYRIIFFLFALRPIKSVTK